MPVRQLARHKGAGRIELTNNQPLINCYILLQLDSIAEIMTPYCITLYRFDDENREQIAQVEEMITELADQGLVYGLEFHTSQ